jgi:hypothetical protein
MLFAALHQIFFQCLHEKKGFPAFVRVRINHGFAIPATRPFSVGTEFIPPVGAMSRAPARRLGRDRNTETRAKS